ncbi:Uma2 family endonuclease (plasmid) [Kitasatospora griseola]|uniref:Uma2 family endonuclease n=1 Tax=Kitasatospora griseola TaxID=2064 RepID=UPI003855BE0F
MSVAVTEHHGPWTVEDVLALPEDPRHRIELVGGALLMSPSPGVPHQRASLRLAMLLSLAIDNAEAPLEVLEAVNVIVPDGLLIPDLVITDATAAADAGTTLNADDIIVAIEIASPSTRVADKKMKPPLYAAAGIPHTTGASNSNPPHASTSATSNAATTPTALSKAAKPPNSLTPSPSTSTRHDCAGESGWPESDLGPGAEPGQPPLARRRRPAAERSSQVAG